MLNKSGKIFGAFVLVLVLFGYSFAQEALSSDPDSIPKGFAAQISQPVPPIAEPVAEAEIAQDTTPEVVAPVIPSPPPPSAKVPYRFYEEYLDSIMVFAKDILPEKQRYEALRSLMLEEKPEAKGEYESNSRYEKRLANFNKEKQTKLKDLDKKFKTEEKKRKKKLDDAVNYSKDIQPEWAGMLKPDTTAEGYQNRISVLKDKISAMQRRTEQVNETLAGSDLFSKSELEDMERKNARYLARLERACELMQDYILQDYAKVLTTDKKNFGMILGDYDPDKEEFTFIMSDANSFVPFDYAGAIKVSPYLAQDIDRKTDDFLASVDYINYPFITTKGEKLYPGAKKAHIFYKESEVPNTGLFKSVAGLDVMEGYGEWAALADSVNSGKLKYRKLDSSYAMKKVSAGPPYWNATRILRATAFVISAASLGVGLWQDQMAKSSAENANKLYVGALNAAKVGNASAYSQNSAAYDKKVDSVRNSEYLRNGLYISAGVFGVAGLVTFAF